jgi:DNA-binding MarR family transcriptional regulator
MGVRNTSRQAFHSLNDLGNRQKFVLAMILDHGPLCNLEISMKSNKPINQITPRTNELVEMGLVEESHREINPITGRRAIYWNTSQAGNDLFNKLF